MRIFLKVVFISIVFSSLVGCSDGIEVDYKMLVAPSGNSFKWDALKEVNAQCAAAEAKSPSVASETNPYCRAARMAGACVREKICP